LRYCFVNRAFATTALLRRAVVCSITGAGICFWVKTHGNSAETHGKSCLQLNNSINFHEKNKSSIQHHSPIINYSFLIIHSTQDYLNKMPARVAEPGPKGRAKTSHWDKRLQRSVPKKLFSGK